MAETNSRYESSSVLGKKAAPGTGTTSSSSRPLKSMRMNTIQRRPSPAPERDSGSDSDEEDDDDDGKGKKEPVKMAGGTEQEEEECPICHEELKRGDRCEVLDCKHAFHFVCIDRWFTECAQNWYDPNASDEEVLAQVLAASAPAVPEAEGAEERAEGEEGTGGVEEEGGLEEGEGAQGPSLGPLDLLTCPCCRAHRGDGSGWTGIIVYDADADVSEITHRMHWTILPSVPSSLSAARK